MSNTLILKGPINHLSLGNVTFNIARALLRKGVDLIFVPNMNFDAASFDSASEEDKTALAQATKDAFKRIGKNIPALNVWHINGSESLLSRKSFLLTFYECDEPTDEEKNLVSIQDHVFFSSAYSANVFASCGLDNVSAVPLGFDPDFKITGKRYFPDSIVHFGLMGKWEKRKHTEKIIRMWIKAFGNNPRYKLTCAVDNPFFNEQVMNGLKANVFGANKPNNVMFLKFMPQNSLVNDFMNSVDIDLTGLSGAEGWNLPSFNVCCLGGHSIILDATGHKDWANPDLGAMISPSGKEDCYDGFFFVKGAPFNQGSFYTFDEDHVIGQIKHLLASKFPEGKPKPRNEKGVKLSADFSWEKTADKLLEKIF